MGDMLKAFDPGLIRLEQAIKGGLAMVTALATMWIIMATLASALDISPVMFAFIVAFISFMAINEGKPQERKRNLLLSSLFYIAGPIVAGFLRGYGLVEAILLLALMFVSFYVRRYGVRAAELGLSALFAYYFSSLFGTTLDTALWFAIGAVVGIASTLFWQFIVRPFDPQRFLRQGVAAFDAAAIDVIDAIARQLSSPGAPDSKEPPLERVHAARQAIEAQTVGLSGAPGWDGTSLRQLRMNLFHVEQGLKAIARYAAICAQRRSHPPVALQTLAGQALAASRAALLEPDVADHLETLVLVSRQLAERAHAAGDDGAWKLALAGLGSAGPTIAQSMQAIRALITQPGAPPAMAAANTVQQATPASQPEGLHPTTVLGIQAVVACGATMLVAAWLNLERPYWAFWTSFIVVAGPAGESLQKLIYRVAGVTLGSIFGSLLALLLPANLFLMLALQMLAMMLALFTRAINYAWLAFWVTTFVALLYSVEGEPTATVLIVRPLNTLIGATIAALVVLFVMPIHVQGKFRASLVGLLTTTDAYLQVIVGGLGRPDAQAAVGEAAMQAAGAYEAVAKTFPAVLLESSPLLHAHSNADQISIVRELYGEVESFACLMADGAPDMRAEEFALIRDMAATIHENLGVLENLAGGQPAALQPLSQSRSQWVDASLPVATDSTFSDIPVSLSVEIVLGRINQTLLHLGDLFESPMIKNPN